MFNIELLKENDISSVQKLIEKTVKISFPPYYPDISIKYVIESLNYEGIKKIAEFTHFYVVKNNDKIIGCGAIGPYCDSKTESSLFNIFVDPDYQHQGIGTLIMNTLENDEYYIRANRIEIPASMLAIPFYKKFGYKHKNNELIYEDGHFKLEKFNNNKKGKLN